MDRRIAHLTAQKHVWVLMMAFLIKLESLRDLEAVLGISRSTLSNASARRDSGFFEELCEIVLWKIYAQTKGRKIKTALRTLLAIDSSEIRVNGRLSKLPKWKAKGKLSLLASMKLHAVWNVEDQWIDQFSITGGRVNDAKAAKGLKIKAKCMYVFDRAYNELAFWWKIVDASSHFVCRLKKHSIHWTLKKWVKEHSEETGVLWEGEWRPSHTVLRKNPEVPKDFTLRHVIYRDPESKKTFHFITSDLEISAQEAADTYKKRWAVELLFKWLKGHLNIRYLDARNSNAAKVYLSVAVLVQLLVRLYQLMTKHIGTPWECLREIRAELSLMGIHSQIPPPLEFPEGAFCRLEATS